MSSGADPFSILNKDPSRSLWALQVPKPQVIRYKKGIKPELAGDLSDKSDSDSDSADMFEDDKTQESDKKSKITHFTAKSFKTTTSSQLTQKNEAATQSQIISKQTIKVPDQFKLPVTKPKVSGFIKSEVVDTKKTETMMKTNNVEVLERKRERRNIEEIMENKSNSDDEGNIFGATASDNEDTNLGKRKKIDDDIFGPDKDKDESKPDSADEEDCEEDSDEMGDDYESIDDDEAKRKVLFRPAFVTKEDRITLQKQQEEELKEGIVQKKIKEEIKKENKIISTEAERKKDPNFDDAIDDENDSDTDLPDDEDVDEDLSYQAWKIRELQRIKRDRNKRMEYFAEKEETERRRHLDDAERAREDLKSGKYHREEKSSYRYLQKFYHMGAFADKTEEIFQRDYNIGVGEDLFDKSNLPSVKHQRRGEQHQKGKSKWTHQANEDTTLFDPFAVTKPNDDIYNSFKNKQAGLKDGAQQNLFEKPSKYRK